MSSVQHESKKAKIDPTRIPSHVAIIMDGNGRWAKQRGGLRILGHKSGAQSVEMAVEAAAEIGVKYLTLYAFSTENWSRPKLEVEALMALLIGTINDKLNKLLENNVRLKVIGDFACLPKAVQSKLSSAMERTAQNTGLTLVLALSYSSQWEATKMVQAIAEKAAKGLLNPADISYKTIAEHLATHFMPDPELLIRTSGELRISNFLMLQLAYAELHFTPVLWPDFGKENFFEAVLDFQGRERRFGKTTEQLKS